MDVVYVTEGERCLEVDSSTPRHRWHLDLEPLECGVLGGDRRGVGWGRKAGLSVQENGRTSA